MLDELAPILDATLAPDPDDRPASELARLLWAALPREAARVVGPPTRLFGPRPPVRSASRRRRSKTPLLLAPLLVLAVVGWLRLHPDSSPTGPVTCAGPPIPVPAGAQVVRGDTAGIGCLTTGVYANEVLTIRLQPTDPAPRRFALGLRGDRISLGDWDCDGVATPALFRPSTGATLYYGAWSANEQPSNEGDQCHSIG